MNGWQCSDTNEGNGYFWENTTLGISAFEDTSEGESRWYAWMGTPDEHDDADQSYVCSSRDEAVNDLLDTIQRRLDRR